MTNYVKVGAAFALLSVAIGAFGAHMLESQLSAHYMDVFHTGVQYQMAHALGILLIAALADKLSSRKLAVWAVRLLSAGIVLFSGSLYALALSGVKVLGAVTPLGGVAFLAGWLCLGLAVRGSRK